MAHRKFLEDLWTNCETVDEFEIKKADRSISPRRPDYNRLYADFCQEKYGANNGSPMFDALDEVIDTYIEQNEQSSIKMQRYEEVQEDGRTRIQPFILAIVTPLMKRVHTMVRFVTY